MKPADSSVDAAVLPDMPITFGTAIGSGPIDMVSVTLALRSRASPALALELMICPLGALLSVGLKDVRNELDLFESGSGLLGRCSDETTWDDSGGRAGGNHQIDLGVPGPGRCRR
ncbi:MAG: hypothetical protein R2735_04890 [Microthrixaceae bacterium]